MAALGTGDFKLPFATRDANPLVAVFTSEEAIVFPLLPFMIVAAQRLSQPGSSLLELSIFMGPLVNFARKDAPISDEQQ